MRTSGQGRALFVCVGLACAFTVFSGRLIYLQVAKHDEYARMAASTHSERKPIYANRGIIQDVNGEILAADDPMRDVVIDSRLEDRKVEGLAELLAGPLALNLDDLRKKLASKDQYIVLKKNVPELVAMELRQSMLSLGMRGVKFEKTAERIYPNGEMLSHVLGFTNFEHKGVQGIEMVMNDYLTGHDGVRFIERNRRGEELVAYRGQETPATNGCNIRLTVDMGLQNIVETELEEACRQFKPEWATVVLMRPQTGEILALANRPTFDPNEIKADEPERMKNRAIIDQYEPGSVFKIVGASAALNEGLVRSDTLIYCENGSFRWGGKTLHDHHGYGELTVSDILMKSSNIGSAKLALQLGDQRFYEYVRRFGFGERTGISLPGEADGTVHPPHQWSKISITRMPMGHEVDTTALQIATSMSVIANGGTLMIPQIVRDIVDENGSVVTRFEPVAVRRVVSKAAAEKVRDALVTVVSEKGTAPLAAVPGFHVAGKTGTANKHNPAGGYFNSKYVSSFVGFMPAEDPAFVCLVVFDDPKTEAGRYYGGFTAAPVFSRIAERAARYMNLVPQPEAMPSAKFILTKSKD